MRINLSLAVLAAASGADAFWRMECRGRLSLARIDPLVSPGEVAAHAHAIHGSSGFSEKANYEDLLKGDCTSCAVTQDKSAYWTPAMYFKHANGDYQDVPQVGGMLAYYFLNKDDGNPGGGIKAFPEDFRMIAGDTLRRNYTISGQDASQPDPEKSRWASLGQTKQTDLAQRALGYNCLNYDKQAEGSLYRHYLPDKAYLDANCIQGVRIEIMFPSCWDGKNTDSPDHRSHVAYPDLVMTGSCPPGFPVKLPGLFYETIWDTHAFAGVEGEFVIANGDVNGFGYHADFMNGWEVPFLQKAVDQCTNLSGRIEDCSLFDIQTEDEQRMCTIDAPSALSAEKVAGLIGNALPGNVKIQYGPGPATAKNPGSATVPVDVPTVTYSEGHSATGSSYTQGLIFHELSTSVGVDAQAQPTSVGVNAQAQPATTPAPEPPADDGKYEIVRTEYVTSGDVVNMIIIKEAVEYITVTTTTVTATVGGAKARRGAHLHRHGRRHRL
ncbi:hypothetical protein B0H66DRAFT_129495 [Apodospora peruviana]|uniref:DUF1996 domain-containing protein n=1 Tax=Apodospora peruviana TaxID=516989 RepID=A0AAE0II78_9PEZI|nr:hypothetical protein B0H66DRAFT_129495 [Apodospora peruviana]